MWEVVFLLAMAMSVKPRRRVTPLSVSLEAVRSIFTGSPKVPKASSAFTFTVALVIVTAPISVAASRLTVPPPLMRTEPPPLTGPVTFSVSPAATVHVWSAARKIGQPSV